MTVIEKYKNIFYNKKELKVAWMTSSAHTLADVLTVSI